MQIVSEQRTTFKQLSAYNEVAKCMVEGLEHPLYLRINTMDSWIFDEIFLHNCYDVKMAGSLKYRNYQKTFNVREPRFILDIGGNIGLAAIYFAINYPEATVITVEPDCDNYFLLLENTKNYKNIVPLNAAVWDKKTTLSVINRDVAFTGGKWENGKKVGGTYNPGRLMVDEVPVCGEKEICTYTLDEILEQFGVDKIDILKIDCEGAEREIFSGKHSLWLPKIKVLVCEHHDFYKPGCTKALFGALAEYNFHFLYDNSDSLSTLAFVFDDH